MECLYKSNLKHRAEWIWVQRPSGLIKWSEAQVLFGEASLVKIENVSKKQIPLISLNHYWISKCLKQSFF